MYWTKYWYDEAGNRTRKQLWRYTGTEAEPILDFDTKKTDTSVATSGGGTWSKISDEFYIRDVSGKELAIYTGHNIEQWNMYGSDNVGKIDANNHRFFYLKDHLGTVRAVLDTANTVIAANDYDAWGYPLVDRSYDASVTTQKYKFTGKEHDNENNYDYFGARYYDSRVANWTSIDPLFEKHIGFSPYNYVLRSPLVLFDPDGKQTRFMEMFMGGDNLKETIGEYQSTYETVKHSDFRYRELNFETDNRISNDVGPIDPVDILASAITGGAYLEAKLEINIAAKVVGSVIEKETATEVGETIANGVGKGAVKFSSDKVSNLYNGIIDYLGENTKGFLTKSGDTRFISADKLRQVRFDIKRFKPHDFPHIDIEKGIIQNGKTLWENIGKIELAK